MGALVCLCNANDAEWIAWKLYVCLQKWLHLIIGSALRLTLLAMSQSHKLTNPFKWWHNTYGSHLHSLFFSLCIRFFHFVCHSLVLHFVPSHIAYRFFRSVSFVWHSLFEVLLFPIRNMMHSVLGYMQIANMNFLIQRDYDEKILFVEISLCRKHFAMGSSYSHLRSVCVLTFDISWTIIMWHGNSNIIVITTATAMPFSEEIFIFWLFSFDKMTPDDDPYLCRKIITVLHFMYLDQIGIVDDSQIVRRTEHFKMWINSMIRKWVDKLSQFKCDWRTVEHLRIILVITSLNLSSVLRVTQFAHANYFWGKKAGNGKGIKEKNFPPVFAQCHGCKSNSFFLNRFPFERFVLLFRMHIGHTFHQLFSCSFNNGTCITCITWITWR